MFGKRKKWFNKHFIYVESFKLLLCLEVFLHRRVISHTRKLRLIQVGRQEEQRRENVYWFGYKARLADGTKIE